MKVNLIQPVRTCSWPKSISKYSRELRETMWRGHHAPPCLLFLNLQISIFLYFIYVHTSLSYFY